MTLPMLGKQPARVDPRTFQFARYLAAKLPSPRRAVDWTRGITNWPMYGNDTLGDCVEAASGHHIEVWEEYAQGNTTNIPTDEQIVQAYSGDTGYVPGDPSTDNGTDMLSFLNYWRKTGVGGHKILAYVKLAPGNMTHLKLAVEWFGGAFIGLQLPVSAQGQNVWTTPGSLTGSGEPGSWGGHCVPVVGYKKRHLPNSRHNGTTVVTWGQTLHMTADFYRVYSDEAYALLSEDWIAKTGLSPSQFDLSALQSDLVLL